MRSALLIFACAVAAAGCSLPRETTQFATSNSNVRVREIEVGRAIGPDKVVTAPTGAFGPADTIFTSVVTEGKAPTATLSARWTHQGALLEETEQRIAPSGTVVSEFHVFNPAGWAPGNYRVEILLNGQVVGERPFRVEPESRPPDPEKS